MVKSIRIKFLALSLSLFVGVFLIAGALNYFAAKSELTELVSYEISQLKGRAELTLPQLIWDFESDQIVAFATAELASQYISGIIIADLSNTLFSATQDGSEQITLENIGDFVLKEKVDAFKLVRRQGDSAQDVGMVKVRYNQKYIDTQVREILWRQVVQSMVYCLALVLLIWFLLNSIVIKPLSEISSALSDIAEGERNLTKRVVVTSSDEIGELGQLFNVFLEKLHTLIVDIVNKTRDMESATASVESATSDVIDSVALQHKETEQIESAVTQMETNVTTVADNAVAAADAAKEASKNGEKVRNIVDVAFQSVENLNQEIDRSCEVIYRLQENVDGIDSILDVIRGIAEQTNLLALNAAIEAARAGEQGRGFAVVADEVRTLAGRTQDSTQEIQDMIARLQDGTREAVETMTGSKTYSQKTLEQNAEVGKAIESITQAQKTIDEMNSHIACSASDQKTVTGDMSQRLLRIVDVSKNISTSANGAGDISNQANLSAKDLGAIMAQFKV